MAETKPKDHAEDILAIVHADIDAVGQATRAAFDGVWKAKGFKIDSVIRRFGEGTGTEPTGYGVAPTDATTAADLAGGSPPASGTTTKAK